MINLSLSNYSVRFTDNFFPKHLTEPFDKFLQYSNHPFKTLKGHLIESIQGINIPGISLQPLVVTGLQNLRLSHYPPGDMNELEGQTFPHTTINKVFPGTSPENEIVEGSSANVTFKNTIFNWMYLYTVLKSYYQRTRRISDFEINIDLFNSGQIPLLRFRMMYCFISALPGMEFSSIAVFNELKQFDATFTFNRFDVDLMIPGFDTETITLMDNTKNEQKK
jgi:hypothetical protein